MHIASLTTCKKRFQKDNGAGLIEVLSSLANQSMPYDKILLNVTMDEYTALQSISLPQQVTLNIVTEDIRSFKKFLPSVKWYNETYTGTKTNDDYIFIFDDDFIVHPEYHRYMNAKIYHYGNDKVYGMRYSFQARHVMRPDATEMPAAASAYPLSKMKSDFYDKFTIQTAEDFNYEDELYYCLYAKSQGLGGVVTKLTFLQFMKELPNNETTLAGKYFGNFVDGNPCNQRTKEIYETVERVFGIEAPNYLLPFCIYDND